MLPHRDRQPMICTYPGVEEGDHAVLFQQVRGRRIMALTDDERHEARRYEAAVRLVKRAPHAAREVGSMESVREVAS